MGCLHLQLAERLPSAHRAGKLRAQANLVNSGCAGNRYRSLVVVEIPNCRGLARAKISSTHCVCFQVDTRASFSRQEIFFVVIENKIHFFLVAFATDF